jgi:hypothetical protein
MGNTQSQSPSPNPIQKIPRKIKLPAVPSLRERPKDSGYKSGSAASSAGTASKGARANDQTGATVASGAGSERGNTPRPETAPNAAEKHSDAPAAPTETVKVCSTSSIYRTPNRLLISRSAPRRGVSTSPPAPSSPSSDAKFSCYRPVSSEFVL